MNRSQLFTLNELSKSIRYGYTASSSEDNVGPKFLRITDIVPSQINWETVPHCLIDEKDISKYCLKPGDIVIARTGATVGYAKLIRNDTPLSVFASYLVRVRIDPQKAYPEYVGRVVESDLYKRFILSQVGGAAQPNANAKVLSSFRLPIPEKPTQCKIASILSAYDDLVATNRRRVQLLEEAARLLFREWFLYFRFPGHEKVKLTDYKGVHIPEGWEYLPITKIKIFKKTSVGVPVFIDTRQYYQTSEIDGTNLIGSGEEVDYENKPSRASVKPKMNSVYFARMKDTNKVLYFNNANSDMLDKILLSTGMAGFTTDKKFLAFLFGLLTSYEFVQNKNNYATGATQVSLSDSGLKKIKVLFPTLNLIELYSEIVNPFLEICSNLRKQNYILSQARDLLLPRLMSGKIDVSKIDINVVQEA
jgi:type I restriction enzyme, S subunit